MTKNSGLAKQLRQTLVNFPGPKGTSVKIMEQPGRPILSGISSNNPFKTIECDRGNCPLGNKPCGNSCGIENITYSATCKKFYLDQIENDVPIENIIERMYICETSRTLKIRSQQHYKDYLRCSRKDVNDINNDNDNDDNLTSFMWDHYVEHHKDDNNVETPGMDDYQLNIISRHKDPMIRQQTEATRIQIALNKQNHIDKDGTKIPIVSLNRKNEFFAPQKRFYDDT